MIPLLPCVLHLFKTTPVALQSLLLFFASVGLIPSTKLGQTIVWPGRDLAVGRKAKGHGEGTAAELHSAPKMEPKHSRPQRSGQNVWNAWALRDVSSNMLV